ncbi:MAG: hypothetical protein A2W80_18870 [Candidatus Riflebacteria bacterium GWC2_50_8]|nr:MAG: hypothetical protein A2W80_18870 [Candidatus Riflebacteria bacterium GWC2_50_8]
MNLPMRMFSLLLFGIAFFLVGSELRGQKTPSAASEAEACYIRGNELGNEGKLEEAKNEYLKAIALDPNHLKAHYNLGSKYLMLGDTAMALHEFDTVMSLLKKGEKGYLKAGALSLRGMAHLKLEHFDEAISDFTQAIAINPREMAAYSSRSIAYEKIGRHEDAQSDIRKAEELKKTDPIAPYNEGIGHLTAGRFKDAIRAFSLAIMYKPDFAQAYNNRSIAYQRDGQLANARLDEVKAQELLREDQ